MRGRGGCPSTASSSRTKEPPSDRVKSLRLGADGVGGASETKKGKARKDQDDGKDEQGGSGGSGRRRAWKVTASITTT